MRKYSHDGNDDATLAVSRLVTRGWAASQAGPVQPGPATIARSPRIRASRPSAPLAASQSSSAPRRRSPPPPPPRKPPPRLRQHQHNLPPAPLSPLTRQQTRRRHPVTQPARRRRRRTQPPRQLIQVQRPRPIDDQQRTQLNRRNRRPDPLDRPLTRLKQDIKRALRRTHLATDHVPQRIYRSAAWCALRAACSWGETHLLPGGPA